MNTSIENSLAPWTEKISRLSRVFIRVVVNLIKHPCLRLAYHINRADYKEGYDSLAVIESLSAGRAVKESELAVKICNCGPDLIKSWALQGGTWGRWGGNIWCWRRVSVAVDCGHSRQCRYQNSIKAKQSVFSRTFRITSKNLYNLSLQ